MYSLGLIGYPVVQSLSPQLHHGALRGLGLAGEYRLYPVPPLPEGAGQLEEMLLRLRRGELAGLNVTTPHKLNVLPLLDELTPAAAAIGAANTLYLRDGRLVGDNTDAAGFRSDLERVTAAQEHQRPLVYGGVSRQRVFRAPQAQSARQMAAPHRALVLGAGGAARAVVYALLQAGRQVAVAARRLEQAQELIADLQTQVPPGWVGPEPALEALPMEPAALTSRPVHLLVNATPLGKFPDVDECPWPDDLPLPQAACVYDLLYNPPETKLMRRAREAGLQACGGLGMLVEQAALALELWTGQSVPRRFLWQALSGSEAGVGVIHYDTW